MHPALEQHPPPGLDVAKGQRDCLPECLLAGAPIPHPHYTISSGEEWGPLAAPFPSCWSAAPCDPQGPLPQDTTYPTQTPSVRGAIPILCLIVPLSTGGQTLTPTLGVWHLQTFNFRVIF